MMSPLIKSEFFGLTKDIWSPWMCSALEGAVAHPPLGSSLESPAQLSFALGSLQVLEYLLADTVLADLVTFSVCH